MTAWLVRLFRRDEIREYVCQMGSISLYPVFLSTLARVLSKLNDDGVISMKFLFLIGRELIYISSFN